MIKKTLTFVDLDGNPANGCEYACTATGPDLPDDSFIDSNCDGIDGDASKAIFVSSTSAASRKRSIRWSRRRWR